MASANDAIRAAEQRLETAWFGLEDMRTRKERLHSGLYNAVVFGRMATFSLQSMRNEVPEFEEWYRAKQAAMRGDPLMRFFHDLRTQIEKEAKQHTMLRAYLHSFGDSDIERFKPAPPGTIGFFVVDQTGGSGWKVKREDGTIEKYYVDVPRNVIDAKILFAESPPEFAEVPAADLVERYLRYMSDLVADAKRNFEPEFVPPL